MVKRCGAGTIYSIAGAIVIAVCVFASRLPGMHYIPVVLVDNTLDVISEVVTESAEETGLQADNAQEPTYITGRYDIELAEGKAFWYNTLNKRITIDRDLIENTELALPEAPAGTIYSFDTILKDEIEENVHINDLTVRNITIGKEELVIEGKRLMSFDISTDDHFMYIDLLYPKEKYPVVILVDPGHGGEDDGAVVNGIKEKDLNLYIAKELTRLINNGSSGYRAFMTRSEDTALPLTERVDMGEFLADFMVSIHHNAVEKYSSVKGTEVYYKPGKNPGVLSSMELARAIQDNLVAELETKDRGIMADSVYKVLNYSIMPSVIVEIGFMTNEDELKRLADEEHQRQAARAIYKGILEVCADKNFRK